MPSTSPAQKRTMAAAAHSPAFAKKVGVPQNVAQDFNQADQQQALPGEDDAAPETEAPPKKRMPPPKGGQNTGKNGGNPKQFGMPRSSKK